MKKHYYAFSFVGGSGENLLHGWCGIGIKNKNVTISDIKEAKKQADMPDNSVLISFSYMGYMTRDEATA